MTFPVGFVVRLASQPRDLVIDRIAGGFSRDWRGGDVIVVIISLVTFRIIFFLLRFLRVENSRAVVAIHKSEEDRGGQVHEAGFRLVLLAPDECLVLRAVAGQWIAER